jgi:hypothetical protein
MSTIAERPRGSHFTLEAAGSRWPTSKDKDVIVYCSAPVLEPVRRGAA